MSTTRYLSSATKSALIADLASFGFEFKTNVLGEPSVTRQPEPMEVISHNGESCIWVGHIPATYSYDPITEESTLIKPASTDWCANVTACEGHTFATETFPQKPYNKFAE
jgi:hypothetical protein